MQNALIDFGIGAISGGLSLSACWGLFWFALGVIGFSRGTCSWRVLLNGFAVGLVPLLLTWSLFWLRGAGLSSTGAFVSGLAVVPMALTGLALRQAQDGRRAGSHVLEDVRHLMDELLGKHQKCSGCVHDHEPHESRECG